MSKVQSSDQLCFDLNFDRGEKFFKRINFLFESTKVVSFRSWLLIRIYLHRIVRFTKVFYSVHVWCIIILFSDIFFLAYTFYFEVFFFFLSLYFVWTWKYVIFFYTFCNISVDICIFCCQIYFFLSLSFQYLYICCDIFQNFLHFFVISF